MSSSAENKNSLGSYHLDTTIKKGKSESLLLHSAKKLGFKHKNLEKQKNILKQQLQQLSLSNSLRSQPESNEASHEESCPTCFFSTFQVTYFTRKIYEDFKKYEEDCQKKIDDEQISLFKNSNSSKTNFSRQVIEAGAKMRQFFQNEVNVTFQQSEKWMKIISEFVNEVQERYQEEILLIFWSLIRQVYLMKNEENQALFKDESQLRNGTVSQKILKNTQITELFFKDNITQTQQLMNILLNNLLMIFSKVSEANFDHQHPSEQTEIQVDGHTFLQKYSEVYPTFQESVLSMYEQDLFCCL